MNDFKHAVPFRHIARIVILIVLALAGVFGCAGGGTTGTAPNNLSGHVASADGLPIEGAVVTLLSNGDSGRTNALGDFSFGTKLESSTDTIIVQVGEFEATARIENIDPTDSDVVVSITVDTVSGIVSAVVIDSVVEPTPQPSVTPEVAFHQTFQAQVRTTRGKAVSGATLAIPQQGVKARSNSNGICILKTETATGAVRFKVTYRDAQGSFVIRGVPRNRSVEIRFTIQLAIELGQIDPGTGVPRRKLNIDVKSQSIR